MTLLGKKSMSYLTTHLSFTSKPRPRPRSKSQPSANEPVENGSGQLRRNASIKSTKKPAVKQGSGRIPAKPANKTPNKRDEKMPAIENLTITANVNNNNNNK